MASIVPLHNFSAKNSLKPSTFTVAGTHSPLGFHASPSLGSAALSWNRSQKNLKKKSLTVVAAVGDVSSDSTIYLIAGAASVALIGTAFPIFFSRKDLCPECDGAGFIRKSGAALRANAARKDEAQIVCPRCNGLGKLNQIDK